MAFVETEAIVLRTYDLSDADKIVVMLTRDFGITRAVAKGAKRLKSRFGSGLEPFSRIRVEYFRKENQELGSLSRADIIESSFDAAADPSFLSQFSYLSEILIALLPPEDPSETLFRMVNAALAAGRDPDARAEAIGLYFEIWLLRLSGFLPDWRYCAGCQLEFAAGEQTRLTADLHLLGESCQRTTSAEIVSAGDRGLVESTRRLGPADFAASCGADDAIRLSKIFRRMVASATGRENISRALTAGVDKA